MKAVVSVVALNAGASGAVFLCVVAVSDVACAGAAAGNIVAQPLRVLLTCAVVAV